MKYVLFILALLISISVHAKRPVPALVNDVIHEGVRYSVVHWGIINGTNQNGGYIEARTLIVEPRPKEHEAGAYKVESKLWGLLLYKTEYKPDLERDVQDVFITSIELSVDKKSLLAINEKGQKFLINLKTRAISQLE